MAPPPESLPVIIGRWQLHPATGELVSLDGSAPLAAHSPDAPPSESHPSERQRLEPKMVELLLLLAESAGAVVSRDQIMDRLWPQTIVGDDTLARTVSKLRKALGDDGKQQHHIETLSKRGYRLIAAVQWPRPDVATNEAVSDLSPPTATVSAPLAVDSPTVTSATRLRWGQLAIGVVFMLALASYAVLRLTERAADEPDLGRQDAQSEAPQQQKQQHETPQQETGQAAARANDFYFQFSRPGNESAIALFEQLVASKPDYAPGYAGLANALVQKVIRWQRPPTVGAGSGAGTQHRAPEQPDFTQLGDAIKSGHTRTDVARQLLARAEQLALHAVALAPADAESLKALGFVYSAQEQFELALTTYQRAVQADPNAWGALINMGDVLEITGRTSEALSYFESAHAAMTRVYSSQSARMLPWYAELGLVIGDRHGSRGDVEKAEQWYRRVLDYAPLHPAATGRMAQLRWQAGDHAGAEALCAELRQRVGDTDACTLPAH